MSIRERPYSIGARVTLTEKKLVQEAAESIGMTVSDFVRQAVMEGVSSAAGMSLTEPGWVPQTGRDGSANPGRAERVG